MGDTNNNVFGIFQYFTKNVFELRCTLFSFHLSIVLKVLEMLLKEQPLKL